MTDCQLCNMTGKHVTETNNETIIINNLCPKHLSQFKKTIDKKVVDYLR